MSTIRWQVILVVAFLTNLSCGEKQDTSVPMEKAQSKMDSLLQLPVAFPDQLFTLSNPAQEDVDAWLMYTSMEAEINRMKSYKLDDVIANSSSIVRASDTLLKTVPTSFQTKPILARIKVLHTHASILHQLCQKESLTLEDIQSTAEEIPVDFNNLVIQLNELYLEMPEMEKLAP